MKRFIVFVFALLLAYVLTNAQTTIPCTYPGTNWVPALPMHIEQLNSSGYEIFNGELSYKTDQAAHGIYISNFYFESGLPFSGSDIPDLLDLILDKSIQDLIAQSDDIFDIAIPESGYYITIELPACWQFIHYSFPDAFLDSAYHLSGCPNSSCCQVILFLRKEFGQIIVQSKQVFNSPDSCSVLNYEEVTCFYVCETLDNIPTEEVPGLHGPCYEYCSESSYFTDFASGGGIDYTENDTIVKIAPKFEVSKCYDGTINIDFLGVDKLDTVSWDSMTVKAITKYCIEYALKFLTGHEQIQDVVVQIPCFVKTSTQMLPCEVPNCCKIMFNLYRYRLYDETYIKSLISYCQANPNVPNLGPNPDDFHLFEVLLPDITSSSLSDLKCYWRIDGNDNMENPDNFIGPTNGTDFIIKAKDTSATPSVLTERMRIKANGKIDMSFNRWNNMPKIVFDASPSNSVFPDDPIIKLYRQTGNDSLCNPTDRIFESYPWWISVTGLNGNNEYGAFNIWNGPSACPGDEASGMVRRFTILNNGNVGIGVSEPSVKLDIFGDVKIEGLTRIKGDAKIYGTVYSNEVIVKDPDLWWSWPDYVLDDNYNLQSLNEIELYIKKYGHLPDIPSSEEIKENGINLSEMQIILMKKIEELTLHLIELKKENEVLKNQMKELKK